MKVALLAPAGAMYRFNGTFKKAIHYAPLTLSTLAAYIPEDIEVVIHDETIEKIPLELDADIVVMTSITGTSERVYKYARYFKSKGKKVILGGPHPTLCPEEAIQHCDSVVIGRSEWLFTEIMEDARNNSLKKFYVQKENSLENLKLPKRELLKKERYVSINSIEATKGCSFDCSFCVGKALYPKLLKRPINEIIAEIETFKKKEVLFIDLNLIADKNYAKKLFIELTPLKKWWFGLATSNLVHDDEMIRLMAKSGCKGLLIGFEAVSKESLRAMNKGVNVMADYHLLMKKLHHYDIAVNGTFTFGADGDDKDIFKRTVEEVIKMKVDLPRYSILTPFPKTKLYNDLEKQGRIFEKNWTMYDVQHAVFHPKKMTAQELQEGGIYAWRETYKVSSILKRIARFSIIAPILLNTNLGYRHYADDIVDKFVEKSIKNGIDIIRTFDALNDVRNIRQASESTKKYGGHSQLAICYTISPVHTIEYYKNLALEMQNMGADSIAIKDMAGILLPYRAYELVTELKKVISVPIEVHTHNTAGLGAMTNLKSVEAGIDIVDTAISPLSGGTSQPTTESLVRTLQGTGHDTGIDLSLLKEIAEYFKPIRKKYLDKGTLNPQALCTEPNIVEYQLPGGMLSNMLSQLKAQKAENRYEDVLKEIPKVREDLGYPPLVTPMSQMIGTQSVFNVLTGERYKMIPKEIKDYVRGMYGKSPVPISEEMKKKIIGDEEVFTGRPADLLTNEYDEIKKEVGNLARNEEDVLTYAMFPQVAQTYFEKRNNPEEEIKVQTINVVF